MIVQCISKCQAELHSMFVYLLSLCQFVQSSEFHECFWKSFRWFVDVVEGLVMLDGQPLPLSVKQHH